MNNLNSGKSKLSFNISTIFIDGDNNCSNIKDDEHMKLKFFLIICIYVANNLLKFFIICKFSIFLIVRNSFLCSSTILYLVCKIILIKT